VNKLAFQDAYKLIIGTIVPRPIAWVSTKSKTGISNLAPFSFFTGVCSNPPTLLFCAVNHPDGREKDTLINIRDTKNFVVNVVPYELALKMNVSSGNFAPEINEFKEAGLTETASTKIAASRVLESPANFECELYNLIPVGAGGGGSGHVVIGKIVYAHYREDLYHDGKVLLNSVQPMARLCGSDYIKLENPFEVQRPK
jgi:flavin reductase (DIM6/NTAB) family NADH-FMN oxidoreductase RutF